MKRLIFLLIFICLVVFSNAQKADVVLTIGHTDQINCLDINKQGTMIASGGNDNLVKVWDISTTKELRTFTGNDGRVEFVHFDPSGKYVSALNYQEKLITWDIATGEIVSKLDASNTAGTFDYCNQGKNIVYLNTNQELVILDYTTGTEIRKTQIEGLFRFKMHPDDKRVFYIDYKGMLKSMSIETGEILSSLEIKLEKKFPITRIDINTKGDLLAACYDDNNIHLYDLNSNKEIHVFSGHTNRLTDLQFEPSGNRLISSDHNGNIFIWDTEKKVKIQERKSGVFNTTWLTVHPTEPIYLAVEMKTIHYVSMDEGIEQKTFVSKGNSVVTMAYDQKGKYIASAYGDISIKLWDISKNKIDKFLMGFFPVGFTNDGSQLVCMGTPSALYVYNPETGEKIKELPTEYELIQNLSFSKDGKYVAGAGFGGIIRIWDLESGKIVKKLSGHAGGIYGTSFSPDGKILASAGMDQTVKIWDIKNEKMLHSLLGHEILVSDVQFSPDGKLLASSSWDKKIFLWNTSTWEIEKTLEGHVNSILSIDFSADGKSLASSAGNNVISVADNSVRIWDVLTGETTCILNNPTGQINKVIFEDNGSFVFTCGQDGFTKIWDLRKCTEVASLASVFRTDYIIVTPDFYYTASKDALSAISFRLEDKLYPFEQFDIKLNRPDVIAERIGKTPPNLMNAYKYVYNKRLQKMNYDENNLSAEMHLPFVEVNTQKINLLTRDSILKFTAHLEDSKYNLNRILVYINGVPVYGRNGVDLNTLKKKSIDYEIKVPLMDGSNQIHISVVNEKGAESLVKSFGVVKENSNEKHDLYIVAVGVSEYQQKDFNLSYAAKDAKDIIDKLTSKKDMYNKINSLYLSNKEVTKNSLTQIKDFISKAKINDIVVVFFAGHGVLDDKFDYYYATHDIDFNQPSINGISYGEIEALFDALKAIRKLLLMDTCHSGELDKEEIKSTEAAVSIKEVKFRSVGNSVKLNDPFGVGNTQELMGMLFTDLKKGSGTTVISSSSGAEFSMESAEYKNGLFTFCLLNSFNQYGVDANLDQRITISEWSKFTADKVLQLSGGLQRPNNRAVNLDMDFRIW